MPIVTVTGTSSELQGVARLVDGRAVFIPYALPGEEVEIRLTAQKERFAVGEIIRVVKQSHERVTPDCPYYLICGGCQTRHMSYAEALRLKREKVCAALTRIGGITNPEVGETQPSEDIDAYRGKAEFACKDGKIGVYREGTHELIEIEKCLLQSESINALLPSIKPHIEKLHIDGVVARACSNGGVMLTLCLKQGYSKSDELVKKLEDLAYELMAKFSHIKSVYLCHLKIKPTHALDGECVKLAGADTLEETLNGLKFRVSPQSFFQVNRKQAEKLYNIAMEYAELDESSRVCDIYSGAGTITLTVARICKSAVGIEIVPSAVSDAIKNANLNKLDNKARFILGDAAKEFPRLNRQNNFDAVFVDPPRKGLGAEVVKALISSPTKRLVYVSCDPATLARDIKLLTQSGVYRFIKARPVDMFPGTSHVETVVLLSRQ